jgi:quercetin dioxygenase-like cupin family protein
MLVFHVKEHTEFNPSHMTRRVFYDCPNMRVMMLCVEAGLELKPHVLKQADGWTYILQGRALMSIDGEVREVVEGDLIIAPKESARGFKAIERVIAIGGAAPLLGLPQVNAGEIVAAE